MRNEHILDFLDGKSFAELSAGEKNFIEHHCAECADCRRAYKAARLGSQMLRVAAAQIVEPSPFFQTRVMANLREKQVLSSPFTAFGKIWRASRTMVVVMTTIVAALIALTAFAPDFSKASSAGASTFDAYSPEMVILNRRASPKEPTTEQVFQIIYESENPQKK